MFGFFVVTELTGEDAQGAAFLARVKSQMSASIKGTLFLPPYLRPNQCNIAADSVVWGCLDEVTGRGCAMFGKDDADFQYFLKADLELQKTLTVSGKTTLRDALDVTKDITTSTGNVTATVGDFEATAGDFKVKVPNPLSLSLHVHATAAPGTPSTPIAPPTP